MDYKTATGHGVGILVHAFPPGISKRGTSLFDNQVFTIEPGYYHTSDKGSYGIRIEDMATYKENKVFNMTFIPYHRDLIDTSILTEEEIEYLNSYNQRIIVLYGDRICKDNTYFWYNTQPIVKK